MAEQTYKYIQFDPNLRAEYGGDVINTSDMDSWVCTTRHISNNLDLRSLGLRHLCRIGRDGNDVYWYRISDNLYPAIIPYLTPFELSTVTSVQPTPFTRLGVGARYAPPPGKKTVYIRGDSISFGVFGNPTNSAWGKTITDIDTNVEVSDGNRVSEGDSYHFANLSNGSNSWANTSTSNNFNTYFYREDLRFNQHTRTLDLKDTIFFYGLGSNDLAYDLTLTAQQCWDRAAEFIGRVAAQDSSCIIIIGTIIKRGTNAALNARIDAYNNLVRANYLVAGAHEIADFEADISEMNIATGDTTDTTIYADGTHPTNEVGYGLMMPVARSALQRAEQL